MKARALFLIFMVSLAICACENQWMAKILQTTIEEDTDDSTPTDPAALTPTADDFEIGGTGTFNYDGSSKEVTVTAKSGKTGGEITVYYEETGSTGYDKTHEAPSKPGTYRVTFDVTAFEGWNAATGLSAGSLVIEITNASGLGDYLRSLSVTSGAPGSEPSKPITIPVKVSNDGELKNIANALNSAPGKYVTLDLTGSSITEIPDMAFTTLDGDMENQESYDGCKTLTGIILPDGITSIGFAAFANCINLADVTIPNGVTEIGLGAFAWCKSLTSLNIPDSVKNIGMKAFYSCTGLTEVNIPNGITTIEEGAFECCSSLASITIPNSVQSIGRDAFSGCTSLTKVIFNGTIDSTKFDVNAFGRESTTPTTDSVYIGDLRDKYLGLVSGVTGGMGTYTRTGGSTTWTKL